MFIHGKTGQVYYSIKDKIKYYSKRAFNDKTITPEQKQYALKRLNELKALDKSAYDEPDLIITDDKHFGNGISKPRLCAVIDKDSKGRVCVAPIVKRTIKTVILDNDYDRQIDDKRKWIDRSNIYETKYIDGVKPLTQNDKAKIKKIIRKK